jgi:amidase
MTEICFLDAEEISGLIRSRQLSAREVMEAHLAQIERANPRMNAIVTLVPERALRAADEADARLARGEEVGPVHGLPVAHKDLAETRDVRTTYGSLVYRGFVPDEDAPIVERLRDAGAIMVGKTNTPEFGAGSQTFNAVFGETLNPYDTTKTCGGSSGGAAVALACGMVPIADGSDMGGSLRNPASFCNVVGFRPTPERVPDGSARDAGLSVEGPMARTVRDVALMLGVISEPGDASFRSLDRDFSGVRVAWSRDLGGLPVDRRVTAEIEGRRHVFGDLGCAVEEAEPDLSGADEVFEVLRAWQYEAEYGSLLAERRDELKDTVVWNIEEGARLGEADIRRAGREREKIRHRVRAFLKGYEFFVLPVSQVPPFDVKRRWVEEIEGTRMETYIDWMKSCYRVSVAGLPAISVPCGFTPEGLPVGVQIVGRHMDDLGVLQLAHAFEQATGTGRRRPGL